jgi:2-C-methyl-D-erythritol 4-phosphate cytidylyltransferase
MSGGIVAIVPAAGIGKRFGEGTNKSLVSLGGKPLLLWALETLGSLSEIEEIIPVLKESDMNDAVELFERFEIPKVKKIAPGGRERQDSVFHGLNLVEEKECTVLVHDGARPLIETNVIRSAISQLEDYDGVVVGVPLKDTVKEAVEGVVQKTLRRESLWSIQTPQIFPYERIYRAYEKAMGESFYSTDDSALVERYGGRIKVVKGSYTNIKITTPEDLRVAELFLEMRGT